LIVAHFYRQLPIAIASEYKYKLAVWMKGTYSLVLGDLMPDIPHILRFQELDSLARQCYIPPIAQSNPILRLPLDHPPIELILVPERCFLPQLFDPSLL